MLMVWQEIIQSESIDSWRSEIDASKRDKKILLNEIEVLWGETRRRDERTGWKRSLKNCLKAPRRIKLPWRQTTLMSSNKKAQVVMLLTARQGESNGKILINCPNWHFDVIEKSLIRLIKWKEIFWFIFRNFQINF